jgi:cytochrome c5
MSRARSICLVAFTLTIAAGVVYGQLKKGNYSPAQLGSLQQAAPTEFLPDASYEVPAHPAVAVALAPGDGIHDVQIYCNTCHSPGYITMQPPLPAATWEAEVNKMNKTFGAAIPEENIKKIILYLEAHYTTENRKP